MPAHRVLTLALVSSGSNSQHSIAHRGLCDLNSSTSAKEKCAQSVSDDESGDVSPFLLDADEDHAELVQGLIQGQRFLLAEIAAGLFLEHGQQIDLMARIS